MMHPVRLLCSLILLLILIQPLQAGVFSAPQPDFSFHTLTKAMPVLRECADLAKQHGVPFGIWGGTVRDLYLDHPFSPISDLDVIFDSRVPGFADFRHEMMVLARGLSGVPKPDFHFDLADAGSDNPRLRLYHEEGITATKVGLMSDDRIIDPTGRGIADLRARRFVYSPREREIVPLENIGRFIRDMVRLPEFQADPQTLELLQRSVALALDERTNRLSADRCRRDLRDGDRITFPKLITPMRNDLRFLHNDNRQRLSVYFPMDMLLADIFRSVTQADSMESMRSVFKILKLGGLLEKAGLARESRLLQDPAVSREELFDIFQFPGHQAAETSGNTFERFQDLIRRYNARVLFDMLISEFNADSREAFWLTKRKEDFLWPSSWRMLRPGDDWRENLEGFLDADFNLGVLPRDQLLKSLDWFLSAYLPYGPAACLIPAEPGFIRAEMAAQLTRGWSSEIRKIDRQAAHGIADLEYYIDLQIGTELRPFLTDRNTVLGFFACGTKEAVALTRGLGFNEVYHLNGCGMSRRKRTLIGYDRNRDRLLFAHFGFHSDEQLLNHQARIYHLRQGKTRLDRVFVLRQPAPSPDLPKLDSWLNSLPQPVDALFIGFAGPLKGFLQDRTSIRIGDLGLMSGYLPGGSAPKPPHKDLRPLCIPNIVGVQGLKVPAGGRGSAPVHKLFVLSLSAFGANYGSLPAQLLQILQVRGLQVLVCCGTAGGLQGIKHRFDWSIPTTATTDGEVSRSFHNAAAGLSIGHARLNTDHVTVISPLVETQEWVRQKRRQGLESVDCELSHLIRAAAPDLKIYALLNITDFPRGSRREISNGEIGLGDERVQGQRIEQALQKVCEDLLR